MKSATRICSSVRATVASKLCATTITGGHGPIRAISRSSACISPGTEASRSMTATVASATDRVSPAKPIVPETTFKTICGLAPKVVRACSSNAGSAVSTTTCVLPSALPDRPIRIVVTHSVAARDTSQDADQWVPLPLEPAPLTAAAGVADVDWPVADCELAAADCTDW